MGRNVVRTSARAVAVGGAGAVLLAACGLGSTGSSSGSTSSSTPPTAFKTIPIVTTTTTASAGGASGAASSGCDGGTYTVKAGDYPLGVAKKLGVTLQALQDANGGTLNLMPGQKLKIPGASSSSTTVAAGAAATGTTTTTVPPDQPGEYTVRPGDAWLTIAQKLGVKAADLAAFNDKTLQSALHPGDKLKIPPSSGSTTTTVKP